jgi:hypothetical protein
VQTCAPRHGAEVVNHINDKRAVAEYRRDAWRVRRLAPNLPMSLPGQAKSACFIV